MHWRNLFALLFWAWSILLAMYTGFAALAGEFTISQIIGGSILALLPLISIHIYALYSLWADIEPN